MLKMVDGTGIIGVDMICPLGVSTPQPPNYDRVELEGAGMLVLPNSLDAPLERLELGGKTEQVQTSGKNLFDFSNLESGRINISTGALEEHNHTRRLADYIDITDITSFSIYLPGYNKANGAVYVNIYYYDKDKNYLSYKPCGDKIEKYENITPVENAVYIKVTLEQNTIDNPQNIFKVQLEKGAKSTDYEPYTGGKPSPSPEYPQEIVNVGKYNKDTGKYEVDVKVTGKNLLNLRNPSVRFDICILQEDGSIKSDIRSNYYFCSIYVDDPYVVDNIKNDQAITFSIGKGIQNRSITISLHGERVGSVNYQEKSSVPGGNSVSIVPSGFKKVSKIELRFNRCGSPFTDTETVVRDFMIHFGESTPYQPYKEQTLTLTSDRPITKWDRLVEQGGEIGWLYGSVIATIDETISLSLYPPNGFFFRVKNIDKKEKTGYCDKLYAKRMSNGEPFVLFGNGNNNGLYTLNTQEFYGKTASEIRAKLKEYPLNIIGKSETTEFVPLPQSEQNAIRALATHYPTTVITADGGELDPDIKVTYRKEI